ncbi:MAG: hypothetical protein MRQ07_02815 [Candidatus Midichloria sp.]|nr:hypothetical protein [Candidatus Midichloria sp.]
MNKLHYKEVDVSVVVMITMRYHITHNGLNYEVEGSKFASYARADYSTSES